MALVALTMLLATPAATVQAAPLLPEAAHATHWALDGAQSIPENAYDGTRGPGTVASQSITINPSPQSRITALEVTVALTHDYIGDLTIELEAPDGRTIFLLNRPGLPFPSPGSSGGGDSSRLSADFPLTFSDHAPSQMPAEMMGAMIGEGQIVGTGGPGNPDNYIPTSGFTLGGLDSFIDASIAGQWTLHVGDATPGSTGTLQGWSLTASTVPEPGTGVLIVGGVAVMALVRRRPRGRE